MYLEYKRVKNCTQIYDTSRIQIKALQTDDKKTPNRNHQKAQGKLKYPKKHSFQLILYTYDFSI
jgi:hypothetical protein